VQPASVYLDAVREEVHDGHHPSLSEPLTHDAEANRANHRRAAELVMQYGYRLSAQVHKYFNLP
jgi:organic radical activating enzyme